MKNDSLNYKFAFVAIIIAYYFVQFVIIYFKPELVRYITLLQILFFVIPIIILQQNNLCSAYRINFKFPIVVIPVILWALVGITLIEIGTDVVLRHILPDFILEQYNALYNNYSAEVGNLINNSSNTALEFCLITLCIAIVPAICEELLFRGYLMQKIEQNNSKIFAIIVSALLFAIIHINPIAFITIFILGLLLGNLFYRTNSILPPIILHFLNNSMVILAANYYYGNQLDTYIMDIWLGIGFTIMGMIIILVVFKFIKK